MEPQFLQAHGVRMAYYVANSQARETIFLIHGNTTSARSAWFSLMRDPAFSAYRLIAIDNPAHGASGSFATTDWHYSLPHIGRILAETIRQLNNSSPYIVASISLGCNMVCEALAFGLQPAGMLMIGPCIVGQEYPLDRIVWPGVDLSPGFEDSVDEQRLRAYSKLAYSLLDEQAWDAFRTEYYSVQDGFRSKLAVSIEKGEYEDEIDLVKQAGCPVLFILGTDEKVIRGEAYQDIPVNLWKGEIVRVKEAGHFVNIDQPAILLALMCAFAADVFK